MCNGLARGTLLVGLSPTQPMRRVAAHGGARWAHASGRDRHGVADGEETSLRKHSRNAALGGLSAKNLSRLMRQHFASDRSSQGTENGRKTSMNSPMEDQLHNRD